MDEQQLKTIWQQSSRQWEEAQVLNLQSWVLNLESHAFLKQERARKVLQPLRRHLAVGIIAGIIFNGILACLLYLAIWQFQIRHFFLITSLIAIFLVNTWAIAVYIHNRIRLQRMDMCDEVTGIQAQLASLRLSMLRVPRIMFLQLPFYCTWFVTPDMMHTWNPAQWTILAFITLAFGLLSVWIFIYFHPRYINRKWFKLVLSRRLLRSLEQASQYLHEIEAFRKDHGY